MTHLKIVNTRKGHNHKYEDKRRKIECMIAMQTYTYFVNQIRHVTAKAY